MSSIGWLGDCIGIGNRLDALDNPGDLFNRDFVVSPTTAEQLRQGVARDTGRLKGHGAQEYKPTIVAIFPPFKGVIFVSFRIECLPEGRLCNFKCLCAIHFRVHLAGKPRTGILPRPSKQGWPGNRSSSLLETTMWDTDTPDEQDRCRTIGNPGRHWSPEAQPPKT